MIRILLIALVGCHRVTPTLTTEGHVRNETLVIGEALPIEIVWNRICHKSVPDGVTMLFGLYGKRPIDVEVPCDARPFKVTISCSIRCSLEGTGTPDMAAQLVVRPLEVGHLDMTLVTTLADNTDDQTYRGFIRAVAPTSLELSCNDTTAKPTPCADTIAATHPLVVPLVMNGNRAVKTSLLTANGRPVVGAVDLATLYPEAAVPGGGIAPGSYKITLAVGELFRSWVLEAR